MPQFTLSYRDPETGEPTQPNPKQAIAHASPAEFLLFGGAAGGGKSEYDILEGSKTCLIHPRVEVAMFRTESVELERSIIPRFLELFPPKFVQFNHQIGKATFPNKSIFWFLHAARLNDVYRHQGAQWVKLLIDEASHMQKLAIEYLITRLRRARSDVRKQVVLTSNPGNVGHQYLKDTFIKPSIAVLGDRDYPKPFEIWRPLPPKNRPRAYMMTRQFIPAFFHDNVILQQRDPHYLDQILEMGGSSAQQLAYGIWDSNEGMMFGDDWQEHKVVSASDVQLLQYGLDVGQLIPWHVIPGSWWPPSDAPTWGSVDYGYGAPWSFHLHAGLADTHVRTFYEMYKPGVRDREQARFIRRVIEKLMDKPDAGGINMRKPEYIVIDPQMKHSRMEVGIAESIADIYEKELGEPLQIPLVPTGGPGTKLSRIQRVKDALAPAADGFPTWTVCERCKDLTRTLPGLPKDTRPGHEEEILDAAEDHAYEDCGRFLQTRPVLPRPKPVDPVLEALDPVSRLNAELLAKKHETKGVSRLTLKGLTS